MPPTTADTPKVEPPGPDADTEKSINEPPRPKVFAGHWSGPIGYVNRPSSDGRYLALDDGQELATRNTPMPLLFQPTLADGHMGAKQGLGNITRMWRSGDQIMGEGTFDLNDPEAVAIARKVNDGFLGWTSIDLEPKFDVSDGMWSELAGALLDGDAVMDIAPIQYMDQDEAEQADDQAEADDTLPPQDAVPVDVYSGFTVMGASLVPYQAFPDARIGMVALPADQVGSPSQDEMDHVDGKPEDDGMSARMPEIDDVVMAELAALDTEWETAPLVAASMIMQGASYALPVADGDPTWDNSAATGRVAKWASSDGSGDKDKVNWSKYGQAFLYKDPAVSEQFGAYKVVDGQFVFPSRPIVDRYNVAAHAMSVAAKRIAALEEERKRLSTAQQQGWEKWVKK